MTLDIFLDHFESSLLNPELTNMASLACSGNLSVPPWTGITGRLPCLLDVYVGARDPIPSPHACPTDTLPTEPSPSPSLNLNNLVSGSGLGFT